MRILGLIASNVKRIVAVEIHPDGSLVIVGGKNGAGKSSTLDAIAYALGGASLCPKAPIRRGAESGRVQVSLGDKGIPELVVERTFNARGSSLTVKNAKGFAQTGPQTILDKLTGKLTFDPLAFASMEPIKQRALLVKLVGLDTADLDEKRATLFQERADAGRDVHGRQTQIESLPSFEGVGLKEVSVENLVVQLNDAEAHNREKIDFIEAVQEIEGHVAEVQSEIDGADKEIYALKECIKALQDYQRVREIARANYAATLPAAQKALTVFVDTPVDPIKTKIAEADGINRKVRANQTRAQLRQDFENAQAEYDRLDNEIKAVDAEKAKRLKKAKFPVEGLGFSESGVTMNGLPFEQASSAEQLRISLAMAISMNPTLRVMLIRDGSLLDSDSMKLVAEMAAGADVQVWLEKVSEGSECSVVIEDGLVRGAEKSEEKT